MNRAIPQNPQFQSLAPVAAFSWTIPIVRKATTIAAESIAQGAPSVAENNCTQSAENPAVASEKREKRKSQSIEQTIPLEKLRWITVRQASIRYPFMTEKAWRHKIAQAEAYKNFPQLARKKQDGFVDCVVRIPGQRKIVIDTEKYEQYLMNSQQMATSSHHLKGAFK